MGLFKLNLFEEEDEELNKYILPSFIEEKKYNGDSLILNNIVAENNNSKLHLNFNVYTTINNNLNLSYNAYNDTQNFKTIDYGKIYQNGELIALDVKTNINNIFLINNFPFELIKKFSLINILPLINNYFIALNEYQIFLFNSSFNLIYIFYSNIFSNINYNRFMNLISNYSSQPNQINKYVNILVDKEKYFYSAIDIINDQIILNYKIQNNIIAQDKNNIFIFKKDNDNKLYRDNQILFNKLLNPVLGYYDNDIFMILGEYNNNNVILYSNEIKSSINNIEKTNYANIHLPENPILFIPINKNNILYIIYKYYDNNEEKYKSYTINNKFELLINNSTYHIINNNIEFNNDDNKYLINVDNNNIEIRKNNLIVLSFIYNNYKEFKKYIYYSIYGNIELIINDIAYLNYQNKNIKGEYEYDIIENKYIITKEGTTEKYIIEIKGNKIIINNISYNYYSNNIYTYKIYSNDFYKLSYDIDLFNHINISCNQIIKEPFKENTQSNILITTKDYLRYKIYYNNSSEKKYVFKCRKE